MPNFFERRDPWGHSPAIWVVAMLAFLAPLGWWSLMQIQFENDVEQWLPAGNPQLQTLADARQLFPLSERILVSWEGSSLGDPRVEALVRKIEGVTDRNGIRRDGLKEVADVIEPKEILSLMQAGDVEPQEAARRLHGVILGAGPLKVRLTEAGRQRFRKTRADLGKAIRKQFGVRIDTRDSIPNLAELAAIPLPPAEEGAEPPPPAAPAVLTPDGELTSRETVDHDLQLVWPGMAPGSAKTAEVVDFLLAFRGPSDNADSTTPPLIEECFFVIGSPVALAVGISEAGLADKHETLEAIRTAAESVGIPRETLRMGGSVVADEMLHQKFAQAAWNTSEPITNLQRRSVILLSALAVAAVSFLMVRSVRLAALVLAAAMYAAFLSLAMIPATGGSLNIVLVVLPMLLVIITLSRAIQVVNHWKSAAADNPATALVQTCRTAFGPCIWASVATAIVLLAYCTSGLVPVRGYGLYGAIGVLISLGVALYGLPALVSLWPPVAPSRQELEHRGWRELGRWLTIRPTMQAVSFLLICSACSLGLMYFRTESKVIRHFREKSDIVQDYRFLEDQVAGIVPVEVLVRFDAESQDRTNILARMELVRGVEERLRGHAEITGCLSLADFQPVTEIPAPDSGMMALSRFHKRAAQMQSRIRDGELAGTEGRYRYQPDNASSAGARPVTGSLGAPGEELWRITAQVQVMSHAEYGAILADMDRMSREVLRYQPGAEHVVTGAAPLMMQTQQAVAISLLQCFGLACALVLGVFIAYLRDLRAALVAMIPCVVPIAVVSGILGWSGQRIDVGAMIAASIALVIAADGTLQYLVWFRQGLAEGMSRNSAIARALEHGGPALWQTSAAIGFGLLLLLPADLLLISRFGGMLAAMVGLVFLADVVLLPQLLAGPLGRWFAPPLLTAKAARPIMVHDAEAFVPPAPHAAGVETTKEAAGTQPRGSRTDGA